LTKDEVSPVVSYKMQRKGSKKQDTSMVYTPGNQSHLT